MISQRALRAWNEQRLRIRDMRNAGCVIAPENADVEKSSKHDGA